MADEKPKRYRMNKLQKFYIDNHLESEPKALAIELGIPADVIDRYMKKAIRDGKLVKKEEPKPFVPPTDDELMMRNRKYGAVAMTEAAAAKGDSSRGAGLKSKYYNDAITTIKKPTV
jgi:hypothetical protein